MGAGAAHASSKIEKQEQISRDVPRICYKILDKVYGCAMGEFMDENVQEKMVSLLSEGWSLTKGKRTREEGLKGDV